MRLLPRLCDQPQRNSQAVFEANLHGNPAEIGAALDVVFPIAMWLAIFMHGVGVELYIILTPREHELLRRVSYERQMARGYANPGSAGLVSEIIGDIDKWAPPVKEGSQSGTDVAANA